MLGLSQPPVTQTEEPHTPPAVKAKQVTVLLDQPTPALLLERELSCTENRKRAFVPSQMQCKTGSPGVH